MHLPVSFLAALVLIACLVTPLRADPPPDPAPNAGQLAWVNGGDKRSVPEVVTKGLSLRRYEVEWSDTLGPAAWQTTGIVETVVNPTATPRPIEAAVPRGAAGRRFVRLKVTKP